MPIKNFEAADFLVFGRQNQTQTKTPLPGNTSHPDFCIDFCDGINIIIGENGVGKTSLLKMLYAACEWSNQKAGSDKTCDIHRYFGMSKPDDFHLKNFDNANADAFYRVKTEQACFEWNLSSHRIFHIDDWQKQPVSSVFIPTTEMLSHARGFLAMSHKFDMPFDGTQIDIIVNAELPQTRTVSELSLRLLEKISTIIDGEVVFENDSFYVKKMNGKKVEFSLEAEGFRKFALVWQLLRNGSIAPGSILFWDEPEANINPELIPALVDILLELQRNDIQIFLATHSYHLARYFDVSATQNDRIKYISLCREDARIIPYSARRYMDIENNPIEFAGDKLFQAIVTKANEDVKNE